MKDQLNKAYLHQFRWIDYPTSWPDMPSMQLQKLTEDDLDAAVGPILEAYKNGTLKYNPDGVLRIEPWTTGMNILRLLSRDSHFLSEEKAMSHEDQAQIPLIVRKDGTALRVKDCSKYLNKKSSKTRKRKHDTSASEDSSNPAPKKPKKTTKKKQKKAASPSVHNSEDEAEDEDDDAESNSHARDKTTQPTEPPPRKPLPRPVQRTKDSTKTVEPPATEGRHVSSVVPPCLTLSLLERIPTPETLSEDPRYDRLLSEYKYMSLTNSSILLRPNTPPPPSAPAAILPTPLPLPLTSSAHTGSAQVTPNPPPDAVPKSNDVEKNRISQVWQTIDSLPPVQRRTATLDMLAQGFVRPA